MRQASDKGPSLGLPEGVMGLSIRIWLHYYRDQLIVFNQPVGDSGL